MFTRAYSLQLSNRILIQLQKQSFRCAVTADAFQHLQCYAHKGPLKLCLLMQIWTCNKLVSFDVPGITTAEDMQRLPEKHH